MTGDVNRLYRWSATYLWVEDISKDILEVWFSDLYGYWRTRFFSALVTFEDEVFLSFSDFVGQDCPQILVILYWLGGLVFPSGFLMLTRLQN
jgi:hypothetical protein